MTRIERRRWIVWPLRLLLMLASAELTLRVASPLLERVAHARSSHGADILCIGDSNTFGTGAPMGRSYPDQLQALIRAKGSPLEVRNLCVPGQKSEQIVNRLDDVLRESDPRCVVFLAGINDALHTDQFAAAGAARPERRAADLLDDLMLFQVLRTATLVLRGDVARREFGGAAQFEGPAIVRKAQWDEAYARAKTAGAQTQFAWLAEWWLLEQGSFTRRAWTDFKTSPAFAEAASRLRLPLADYEWELALLAGEEVPPVPANGRTGDAAQFAALANLHVALASGRLQEADADAKAMLARKRLSRPACSFVALHSAWSRLMARDFAAASRDLLDVVQSIQARNPLADQLAGAGTIQGIFHALGGAAVAHLLAAPDARLDVFRRGREVAWKDLRTRVACPDGREWLYAAELLDVARTKDARALEKARARITAQLPEGVHTRLLQALLRPGPVAPFDELRASLPLDPPRLSWIGPNRAFFRTQADSQLEQRLGAAADRIADLVRNRDCRVVWLTYLDPSSTAVNKRLCSIARDRGWRVVDLHALHARAELEQDDRRRFFSPDRGHPNEAGYGLVAQAVADALEEEGVVTR